MNKGEKAHIDKKNSKDLYKKDVETEGIDKNVAGEQTLQTEETKILKGEKGKKDKEILIGKDLKDVKEVQEEFDSLQRKLLNKLM